MDSPENNKPKSDHNGLANELKTFIRDEHFQATANKFVRKSNTRFKIIKGVGFALALASGLFGYFLKANSEADDRKALMIQKTIETKQEWAQKVVSGLLEIRKVQLLIKHDCEYGKAISLYEQALKRLNARHEFITSFSGIRDVFGNEVFQTCREITKLEEETNDVCAKNAPTDEIWRELLVKINNQMHASIEADREELRELSQTLSSTIFRRL